MHLFPLTLGVLVMICRLVVADPCSGGKLPPVGGCPSGGKGHRVLITGHSCVASEVTWCCAATVFQQYPNGIPEALLSQIPDCKQPH
ncbi:hypothetical protein Pst134EA_025886 [Puccinia striiformis f. sp. tritici]|uniref:hypothetical protein n=1 Tax=Puccinia striiformis f. sp. tritici TaxID=168172 RepID=UPI00200754C4|nr:hypothetical protein Pst134EA_025886 [Puccinia striiformis f. sp. tritici]KAH9444071.1 hypothetical protein Pst134EB_026456 [Puccinia striiformis f. sp. tritici]KAH9451947.1 hypothetical protein Pst134EA_025886 [Puccinia striiformis f. sp. tritici]